MSINTLIKQYKDKYKNGEFFLNKDEAIGTILAKEKVPNQYGVYLIYSIKHNEEKLIYIGKAGTIENDGSFKKQGLNGRLKAKQNKKSRSKYFKELIEEYKFDKLKFLWFITYDTDNQELPIFVEMNLIQAYFKRNQKLPMLNKNA